MASVYKQIGDTVYVKAMKELDAIQHTLTRQEK